MDLNLVNNACKYAEHLLTFTLSVLLILVGGIIAAATLTVILISFGPYILIVTILAKLYRPNLISPVVGDSIIFTTELPQNGVGNVTHLIPLDGTLSTESVCKIFTQRVLQKKTRKGELMFYRYRYTWTRFLGYNFWEPEEDFRAENHVREYDLDEELKLPKPCHEKDILNKYGALTGRAWKAGVSPWELLVIQDYRTEVEPALPRTAILLRYHHALGDGYGIASVIREFSSCPLTLPTINVEVSFLAKFLPCCRLPYDLSKLLAQAIVSQVSCRAENLFGLPGLARVEKWALWRLRFRSLSKYEM